MQHHADKAPHDVEYQNGNIDQQINKVIPSFCLITHAMPFNTSELVFQNCHTGTNGTNISHEIHTVIDKWLLRCTNFLNGIASVIKSTPCNLIEVFVAFIP
jgi:hypothetical protein